MTLLSSATFPLSQAQMRIWYMEKINQGTPMNNIVGTMFFQHRMEEAVLTQAIRLFLEQHEEVRLRLIEEDGLPRQFFDSRPVGDIERIEFEEEAHLQAYAAAEASKPIDLMREDLCRFTVFTLPGERVGLLLKMHHLISDAWTMTLIGSLLMDDYQALLNGQAPVKKSDYSYLTYLNEEYDFLQSDRAAKMKEFWRQKFAELPERTTLSSRQQVPGQTQAKRESFVLSEGLTERIHAFCQEHRLSVFSLFLSLLYVYINRTKLAPEATVLTSVLNRHSARDKSTIGMFVSTMPIRLTVDEQESYVEFADRIKREQKACYRNQRYPYNLLVNDLREDHGMSADELFDVVFSYQNAKFAQGDHGYQYDTQWHFTGHQTNSLTFHVYDHEERGQLKLDFDYRVDQFTADELQRLYKRLMMLLADVMAHPEKKVSDLNLLPEAEREQLLFGFNETKRAFPDDRLLQELFEEQATRQPEHPALVFEGRTLTYGEVNEQANALAHQLRERGVGVETVVGVLTNRSLEGIVAILGILKAGGAFLPIDPEYPQERIEYMLEISQAEMLLVQSALTQRAAGFAGEVLLLDEAALYQGKTDNPEPLQTSTDLGYIIFSSGSTGRPKGSMLTHKSLVNWLYAMNDLLDGEIGSDDRCLSLANSSFDANVGEIFLPLVFGGTLVLFNTRPFDILKLVDVMESERATMALLMPFLLKDLHPFLHGRDLCLNKIWTGAESVQDTVVEQYFNLLPDLKVLNVYGPSETTIGAAIHRYESQDKATGKFLPIGKPIANTQIYIVGHGDRLQPIGEPGEILIGGDGVGVGYINQPELTAERFVPNPFDSGTRAYRTGDLARWLPDGTLEFLSRIDYQVKIRGFRIEIGEIETALSAHPQVDNVFVTDRLDKNENKYLCAYLVTGAALTSGDLRRYLSDLLPEYMVPSYFMFLDRIPTTPNGKVDKNALPEPELNGQAGGLQLAPRDELEASVAAIWSDVLELEPEQVGIQDNFFDLGGHSLKASTLIARIYQKTGVKLPLRAVFQSGTIEGLAALIRSTEQEGFAPIERVAEAGDYSLSSAQHRLFILQQLSEQDTAYNMPGALQLEGDLDVERLEAAVRSVITRHDALRTAFVRVEGEPRQVVREAVDFTLPLIEGQEAERQARMRAFVQPFDLTQAPLFRMQLLRVAPKRHLLLFDMHHIISDGASINLLLQELIAAYRGEELQPLAIQYKDYAAWQDGFFTTERLQGQQAYWTEQFADEVPVLNLTGDFSRPTVMEHAGHALRFEVGRELTDRLRVLANDNGLTLYMILLAAYSLLLGKYANQEDLVIGTPVSGRAHPDAESVMGMFVNTLALRLHPERDLTMEQFLAAVKERVVTAFDHQDYPLEQLIERLGVRRDLSRNPLFDVMFVLQNADLTATDMDGVVVRPEPFDETMAKFDLTLEALETDAGLSLRLEYRTNVFAQATIERMSRHFVRVLEALCKEPTTSIGALELTLPEEREQILQAFNETEVPFDGHLSLSEVFERQAAQTPEAVALQADGKTMSYGELNAKANRLARVLRREGVGPDSLVAAVLERSTEMMIAVLAIHKAGGAYLPISPDWPTDRIAYLVKDSAARVVLTQGHLQERLSFDGAVPVVVVEEPTLYVGEVSNLERLHTSHNLAYVIYTSGSTGKPKGVMVEHANVINRIQWAVRAFGFTSDDVILQKTPFVFDVSVWELFTWMFVGAQVCFLEPGGEKEPERIAAAVEQYGVTSIHFVPSMLSVFLDALEAGALLPKIATLQRLFTSGETLTTRQVQRFHQIIHPVNAARIYNMYGPTETTVEVTAYPVPVDFSGEVLPIGRPIYNSRLYVLDAQGNLQPIGVPGELVISGANVARGYLNRPDLTAEKFLDDPFAPGERMYRSGDLARWLPDGNLDYQGRMDFQVKVRGYRIELGEIEAQLLLVDGVKEAVVLTRADAQGDRDLVAYLVTESKTELTTARLRDALTQVLPEYMIPSYFLFLERMPVTSNGKVDRKALPEPATDVMRSTEYVAPRTETEAELAAIWSAVLDVEQVGVRDNFFELGGHSLKASSLVARIYQKMGVKLPLRAVFQEGTIEQLAALIQRTEQVGFAPIEPVAAADDYPLSSAQHRLFILQQLAEQDTTYNMSGVLRLEGDLNVERLEAAVQAVIARHEVLRTAFVRVDGEPRQVVREAVDFSLTFTEAREPDLRAEMEAFVQPFDLAHAPLLRMRVLRVASERHLLLFDMHHIISDGASVNLLMQDLIAAYRGEELQPLAVQYKDYAAWQDGFFTTERLQEQQAYWQEQFVDEVPVLNLTGDFSRPAVMEHAGHAVRFEVGRELTDRLQRLAAENGLTLYMILLAAYSLLLCKYANQEDLVIGTPVAGRAHPDAESVMGMFVNTLTLRLRPERERTIEQFLAAVKEHVVAAFDHQDYPYEGLIEQVGVRRDLSRNPLFDVMFVLQNADLTETQMGDVVVHPQAYDEAMAKFDLTLEALESGTGLSMRLEYRTKLFAQATIERMSRHLMQVLEALCAEATTTVGELELALPEEREQILQVFNDTDIPFDEHKTLPQIFEEQVAKTPEAVALQADGKVLTYAELNAKANQLARVLRREGVGPDTLVAMLLERSAEMMMAVLAVHKAGGAYVPIMPDWPAERIAYLLADSAAQVVLTQERLQERLPAVGTVLTVDDPALYAGDASNLEPLPQPTDLAYVIYTSGSTGKPKGVMVEHRSVINRIEWAVRTFAFAPHDVILQKTPY
ncbi:MAG TPA: amino acid adenylation domain-containing protein, partial [Bacilli bacterium]|nr:amino acid adenylation domain-containing protein [Bacilli bacterium]